MPWPLTHVLLASGCWWLHLLLGHDIFLTLSDIVILFLGDICFFDVHHIEVNLGLSCCCSDFVVFEGTLEVCRILDKFWTYDPILCGTWDMKVVFDLEEKRKKSGRGGETVRSSVTTLSSSLSLSPSSTCLHTPFAVGQGECSFPSR